MAQILRKEQGGGSVELVCEQGAGAFQGCSSCFDKKILASQNQNIIYYFPEINGLKIKNI